MKKTFEPSKNGALSRHKGRIIAFQGLYLWSVQPCSIAELCSYSWLPPPEDGIPSLEGIEEGLDFPRLLMASTIENLDPIDSLIQKHAKNWALNRINKVDLAILRVSVCALLYFSSIPHSVTIDEAVVLSKMFSTDESYRFVNGVLDGVLKETGGQIATS